jgi:hypothetical protein
MRSVYSRLPLAVVAVLVVGCASAASPRPSPSVSPVSASDAPPSPSALEPSASATGSISHPTGADEVVLRYEEEGGFVPAEWLATRAPIFTLYGDGRVVFRDPALQEPPDDSGILRHMPFQTLLLSEEEVQRLLRFAAEQGGLGVARDDYPHDGIADATTAAFTMNAGGRSKRVSVYALGIDDPSARDAAARRGFAELRDRLQSFEAEEATPVEEFEPEAWRGVLIDAGGAMPPAVAEWPWSDLEPADFATPEGQGGLAVGTHRLDAAQVEALGPGETRGGIQGIYVEGPDGKAYSLSIRPLLPDEEE